MKTFVFPLARILDWRRTQAGIEEMKLSRLQAELRDLETQIASARTEQADSERDLIQSGSITGASLAALDSFKKSVAVECARLEALAGTTRKRIAQQLAAVAARRRDARLLEKLGQKKLSEWKAGFSREIEQQAEEAYTSRRHRASS